MKRYEIWWAKVAFEDMDESKIRPVMIWNNTAYILAYKMTSVDRGDSKDEFRIEFYREAGLPKETFIRISKLLKLEETDLISKIGELDDRDRLRFNFRISAL